MDRMVEFRGAGPVKVINAAHVMRLVAAPASVGVYTHIFMANTAETNYTVAGTPEEVAKALGFQWVVFEPLAGITEASQDGVE